MSSNRAAQIESLCLETLSKDERDRAAFLDAACSGDEELRREVESLLVGGRSGVGAFLERPAWAPSSRAPLAVGTRLGPYEVLAAIGAGGMGEVYKARDTRLGRTVAIKVLPPDASSDPERRARFEREAKIIAGLNHPHICVLHDVGDHEGSVFLVMEHLAGQTLAHRLETKRPLPLEEALKIATEIADALSAAHRQGVIHRDLKPANVVLAKDGAKLLDFGLAKLTGHTEPVTSSAALTGQGVIVGTLPYMAPEQLEGRPADARSDIWALGAILYEMATGKRAFDAPSTPGLIAAILEHHPAPASALQPLASPLLDRLIERCLAKDPAERWESAHDIADELRWIAQRQYPREAGAVRRTRRWGWISASAAVVAVLTLVTVGWLVTRSEAPAELSVVRLTTYLGEESSPSFSPDGTKVAFSWSQEDNTDIYVKQIGSAGPPMRLTSSPASDQAPAWSPDDRWIAFTRQARGQPRQDVLLVSPLGGPERKLAETRWQVFCWTPDGKWIVMGDVDTEERLAIWAVGVETGERRRLTAPLRAGRGQGRPSGDADGAVSPDGRTLAFSRGPAWIRDLYVMPLTGDMRPAGEPARITKKHYGMVNGVVWMPDGREILYGAGSFNAQSLWRVPVSGKQAPRRLPFAVPGEAFLPAIAHRTSRLAYTWRTLNINLWRLDIRTGERRSVVQSTYDSRFPQYSPDGRRIAFQSGRSGDVEVWACDADGSNCQQLTSFGGPQCGSPRWSPDGRWLALDGANEGWFEVYVIAADGGSPRRLTIGSGVGNNRPSWSRDGQWVYFDSNRSGQRDIWKIPASGGQAVQVTRSGGEAAQPSPDGKYIYYVKPRSDSWSSLFRAPAEGGEERQVVPALVDWHFAVTANAVYFFNEDSLQQLDLATGRISTLAPVPAPWGISASSDGRYVLWAQIDRRTTDLMLVENFR